MNKLHSRIVTGKGQPQCHTLPNNPALTAFEMSPAFAVKYQPLSICSLSAAGKYRKVPGLNRRNGTSCYSTDSVHKYI
jgi:hypothetical protein